MATIAGYTPKLCGWLAGGAAAVALLLAAPLPARAADYDTTLAQLDELQTLAETYVQEQDSGADPLLLALSYTRSGAYNDTIWQLTAGTRDASFESYVLEQNGDLAELIGILLSSPTPENRAWDTSFAFFASSSPCTSFVRS